jgi:hypothetical protein
MILSKQATQAQDARGDTAADDALEAARTMPPGPERSAALKQAGLLRHAADSYGLIFARRGRAGRPTNIRKCDALQRESYLSLS